VTYDHAEQRVWDGWPQRDGTQRVDGARTPKPQLGGRLVRHQSRNGAGRLLERALGAAAAQQLNQDGGHGTSTGCDTETPLSGNVPAQRKNIHGTVGVGTP
jgi:hypothetical protein